MLSRRDFLKLAGVSGAGLALGLKPSPPNGRALRLIATGRSITPSLLRAFSDSAGIAVQLDSVEGNDPIAGHDLAIVPSHVLTGLIRESHVRELGSISAPFALEQRAYDPLDAFSLPAARGAIGIKTRGIAPPATWAEFFDLARIEPAHLPVAESFAAALKSIGHSINTRDTLARNHARARLAGLKPASLPEARLAIGAQSAGWGFTVPSEGAELWEDCFCIPARSRQPDLARSFIRFALTHQPPASLPDIPLEPRSPFAPPPA